MSLTPTAVLAAIFALALGILGQWSAALGPFPIWRLPAALIVLGLVHEMLVTRAKTVHVRLTGGAQLRLGREETLSLELGHDGSRPLSARLVASAPASLAAPRDVQTVLLPPGETRRVALPVRALELGRHAWETVPAHLKGPLGLAWWSRRLDLDAELEVLPDTLGPRSSTTGVVHGGSSAETAPGGAMQLHHLRAYRPGDPLNSIDWKATARTGGLVTRVFNEDQHLEVMILVDAGRTSRTQIDEINQFGHYVNLAARFAEYCVAGDDRVGLVAFADRPLASLPPGRGLAAVQRIRRTLTGVEPLAVESDVLQAALYLRRLLRHRCLVVILTDLYERSATSQLVQASRLLLPNHLPLIVGITSEDVVELAGARAADWLDPYRSLAAREYQHHVAASVARLARLGAHALTARARELDRRVLAQYDLLRAQRRI